MRACLGCGAPESPAAAKGGQAAGATGWQAAAHANWRQGSGIQAARRAVGVQPPKKGNDKSSSVLNYAESSCMTKNKIRKIGRPRIKQRPGNKTIPVGIILKKKDYPLLLCVPATTAFLISEISFSFGVSNVRKIEKLLGSSSL